MLPFIRYMLLITLAFGPAFALANDNLSFSTNAGCMSCHQLNTNATQTQKHTKMHKHNLIHHL